MSWIMSTSWLNAVAFGVAFGVASGISAAIAVTAIDTMWSPYPQFHTRIMAAADHYIEDSEDSDDGDDDDAADTVADPAGAVDPADAANLPE